MKNETDEFSFVLRPADHGVGVFAVHGIKKGTYLRLFGGENQTTESSVKRRKEDVSELFQKFCIVRDDSLICPKDFGHLEIGWYINHSGSPNSFHKNYHYYAARDIEKGEEITIDYNSLEEPEEAKENYYK